MLNLGWAFFIISSRTTKSAYRQNKSNTMDEIAITMKSDRVGWQISFHPRLFRGFHLSVVKISSPQVISFFPAVLFAF